MELTPKEKELIRLLQKDLPLMPEPFAEIGKAVGMTGKEVLEKLDMWMEEGLVRRFGAAVRHYKLGYGYNVLTVWNPDEGQMDNLASILASRQEISHIYQRPSIPGTSHSLFAMVHGRSKEEAMDAIEFAAEKSKCSDYLLLKSTQEFKRDSMRYFLEED